MIRRTRRAAPRPTDTPLVDKITSILLQYPDNRVLALLPDVTAALPAITDAAARDSLGGFACWLAGRTPLEAAQHYVVTFDHTRRRSLYLTYYRHGDTRARGMALLALKHTYRQAGFPAPEDELPDFLPLMLEFAAAAPEPGRRVLIQCQAGLELLTEAVSATDSPYAALLDVVRAHLPALQPRHRAELRALSDAGPPVEQVGLEPFAPPEYVTGGHR
ncbi:nitrate reductase molybdenum cofactor assembly chaperone [Amycolatopsis sp. FDAARGOS 1241]|uniref:nitrate reductase molybdenum cofactor assembly chaperone n=1 Tax=Amycolatopsis sp. FDAARGOS 1241 TaxID=2778070 RepID=UPI00194DE590|nr:nitrate reductase molybdenum cofactor assembly chaperone [Amycolatopsis sp. FDAARGOS 1241]QRP42767.1 nitrate reductase molybdenum cofactor assembly chaperone [Amycolatopsis sp. FDAARGOS 1241]